MKIAALILLATTTAAAAQPSNPVPQPTPQECRGVGVAVLDSAVPVGRVSSYRIETRAQVELICGTPRGCYEQISAGLYETITTNDPNLHMVKHQACHALYSVDGHTTPPDDILAAHREAIANR